MAGRAILLAAGGTGGHLFPAEALARELTGRGWDVHLATDMRADRFAGRFAPENVHIVRSATVSSKYPIALLRSFWTLWQGYRDSVKLLRELEPAAVVGFGGYPTIPPLFAATGRGIPALIHEQNAVMGRANKALAARVEAIAGGFLPAAGAFGDKIVATGNPVRPEVIEASAKPYRASRGSGPFRLLVFGGSQGARFFSRALPEAIAKLPGDQRKRLAVVQQARPEDEAGLREAYRKIGIEADISVFFADLAKRIANAHMVVSRSGASTVSEIAVIGRPALLVPYPHALDHDQAANAAALAQAGGARVCPQSELDPERLAGEIGEMMNNPDRAKAMANSAKSAGKPAAARLLADLTEAIAARKPISAFKEEGSWQ